MLGASDHVRTGNGGRIGLSTPDDGAKVFLRNARVTKAIAVLAFVTEVKPWEIQWKKSLELIVIRS
jgi:hypothetical protein